jgi:serine/threonine-protein kinase
MLAVLPFENLGNPEDEYFADGITEEITSKLAKVSELIVIGSHSAKQYKGTTKPIGQIGDELGVNYLLCGTVRWQKGDNSQMRVRVTPQLLKVSDGSNIWSDIYESLYAEIFAIQSSIATKVVSSLDIVLADSERKALGDVPTNNLEAYDFFIRARDYLYNWENRDDIFRAISLYEKAIELDSSFVEALVELSSAYSFYYWAGWDPTGEIIELARQTAVTASRFDFLDSYWHHAMGYYYYYSNREYQKALDEFQKALKLRPNDHNIIAAIGFVQRRLGYWEKSLETMIRAVQIEPLKADRYYEVAMTARFMRKYEVAEQWINKGLSLFPDYSWLHNERIQLYVSRSGDPAGGLEKFEQINIRVKDTPEQSFLCMQYSYWAGKFQKTIEYGHKFIKQAETFDDSCLYFARMGDCYQYLNDSVSSKIYYDSAKAYMDSRFDWDDPHVRRGLSIPLGIVYAELGQPQEAVRLAEKLASIMPISKDALSGTDYQEDLAFTYIRVGMYDEAIAILDTLLTVPSDLTVPKLRANRHYEALWNYPKFQALLKKYETN